MKKQNEDFAIIHDTPKGQLLITKEPNDGECVFTIWVRAAYKGEIGLAKIEKRADYEDADIFFEWLKDYEAVKKTVNKALNQEYL